MEEILTPDSRTIRSLRPSFAQVFDSRGIRVENPIRVFGKRSAPLSSTGFLNFSICGICVIDGWVPKLEFDDELMFMTGSDLTT
jgi:hypothetical protein